MSELSLEGVLGWMAWLLAMLVLLEHGGMNAFLDWLMLVGIAGLAIAAVVVLALAVVGVQEVTKV